MGLRDLYEIVEINKPQARELVSRYHYLGAKGFRYGKAFGLRNIESGELVGAAVFHSPSAPETVVGAFGLARTEQGGVWELGRFVLDSEHNGKNCGSFLLGRAIRMLRKTVEVRAIITYADSSLHHGGLYQATNFVYCGLTTKKKDFYIRTEDGFKKQERGKTKGVDGEWRDRPQKHRYVLVYDEALTLRWVTQDYYKEATECTHS